MRASFATSQLQTYLMTWSRTIILIGQISCFDHFQHIPCNMSAPEPLFKKVREMPDRAGLYWKPGQWPKFADPPAISVVEQMCRRELKLKTQETCSFGFMGFGTRSRIYSVDVTTEKENGGRIIRYYVLKVILPVFPVKKTTSEVATMKFVKAKTSIPVPKVLAYSTDPSELGFEWILMYRVRCRDKDLTSAGVGMPLETLCGVVKQVAKYQAELCQHTFSKIGSLQIDSTGDKSSNKKAGRYIGSTVSTERFKLDHLTLDIPKKTCDKASDWLKHKLDVFIHSQDVIIRDFIFKRRPTPERQIELGDVDIDDIDKDMRHWCYSRSNAQEAIQRKMLAEDVKGLIPRILKGTTADTEPFVLYHHDLNTGNDMVDKEGNVTGILDWEMISTVPLWHAAQLPPFLIPHRLVQEPQGGAEQEKADAEPEEEYFEEVSTEDEELLRQTYVDAMKRESTK